MDLAEFAVIAGELLGVGPEIALQAMRADLADSALHAPAAGFGDVEFYPKLLDKAAVLCAHLCWNHALPDANKRAAWLSMVIFLDLNGVTTDDRSPDDDAFDLLVALADHRAGVEQVGAFLRARYEP